MSEQAPDHDLAPLALRLQELRDLVDRIGREIDSGPPGRIGAVIQNHREQVYAAMDNLGNAIHEFELTQPAPDRLDAARRLVADPLREWSTTSPVFFRSQAALRRKFGYYELAALMHDKKVSGADSRAMIFHDYYLHSVTGEAFRNRLSLISERLLAEVSRRLALGYRSLRIVCLHHAGGAELMPLAENPEMVDRVQITLLDASATAIRHAKQVLGPVFKECIGFQRADAARWLYGPDCKSGSACIVYAFALLEQRDTASVVQILQGAYQLLREGGILLAGSVTPNAPISERSLRGWLLERDWHYRDEHEWRMLLSRTKFAPDSVTFDYEPLHVNLLLAAQRTAVA